MNFKQSSCDGKRGYESKGEAKLGISYLVKAHGLHRSHLSTYQCAFCRKWHVGNKRPEIETLDRDIAITAAGGMIYHQAAQ